MSEKEKKLADAPKNISILPPKKFTELIPPCNKPIQFLLRTPQIIEPGKE